MSFSKTFLALTFAVTSAWAGQGVVLAPGEMLNFSLPNAAPYAGVLSNRIEFRMHDWTVPVSYCESVINTPQLQVRLLTPSNNSPLAITDWADSFTEGQGNTLFLNTTGMKDIIVRVQRDTVGMTLNAEVWNASGDTNPVLTASIPIDGLAPESLPFQGGIGDTQVSAVVDYVRWFSTVVSSNQSPFNSKVGDLFDFEFDGTLSDSSSNNLQLSPSMSPSYVPSPIYPPFASQGPTRIFKAGVPQLLSGLESRPLNGSNQLTFQWKQISGPSELTWSSTTVSSPTIEGLVFGSYQIQLTVTDSTGVSSTNVTKYGAVFTDENNVVIPPASYITTIMGPMLKLGTNPWPYFDQSQVGLAKYFGGLQSSSASYQPVWNTAQSGTITVSNGSTTVTGQGTSFLSTFCAGSAGYGYNNATLIVWYPVSGSPGQFGRAPYTVSACQSDTSMTLMQSFNSSSDATGLNYTEMDNSNIGNWINGSSNANYYDNVMAFYNLYYRSGIDDYLNFARTLADRWYSMPWFDQGRASLTGTTFIFPRLQSLTGIILRAFDGQPDYWNGIRLYVNADFGWANTSPIDGYALNDVREQSYATAFVALAALFDPLPANQSMYASEVETMLSDLWAPTVQPAGNWENQSYGNASWNGLSGTATVTNGSTVVIGQGTDWQPGWFNGNAFWTAETDAVTDGDAIAYTATVVSPTQLTLNIPYQGTTASGRGWEASNLVGVGSQPFMLGITARMMNFAYLATNDSRVPGYLAGLGSWFMNEGYRPDARGLWYGRVFPNCEPISTSNQWCTGGDVEQSRFLSGEIVGALSAIYSMGQNPNVLSFGDNIYGAMFGGPTGGPDSDSTYITDISPGGWAEETSYAKDFGFFFGFGGGSTWPAARLGASMEAMKGR